VRQRAGHIKGGTFAAVIRAYLSSPKYEALAQSTRKSYGYLLGLAEQPETLGAYSVEVIRPALVQAFLDGLADRPAQQKNAQTALKAVERWAIVRDLLPYPITTGTEAPGGTGGYEPWTDEQVELAERCCRPHLARVITLGSNTGQRGSDLVKMAWSDIEEYDGRPGHQCNPKEDRPKNLDSLHARADPRDRDVGAAADADPFERRRSAVHARAVVRPMAP